MRSDPEMVLLLLRAEYKKQSSLRGASSLIRLNRFMSKVTEQENYWRGKLDDQKQN